MASRWGRVTVLKKDSAGLLLSRLRARVICAALTDALPVKGLRIRIRILIDYVERLSQMFI